CWHTQWQGDNIPQFPHEIQIRLDKPAEIQGFTVVPRTDMQNGDFAQYAFYVSADGKEWGTPAAEGTFTQFYQPRTVELNKPVQGQFVRLVALTGANQQNYVAIAELMLQTGK
ncbi:MAG TPA: discoidin domain-containing protein, partial [Candidatus Sumerlaeota bacterium]|nr:discoidin domain-containing protein [Candidatus Sumerlaeota bacterium]